MTTRCRQQRDQKASGLRPWGVQGLSYVAAETHYGGVFAVV